MAMTTINVRTDSEIKAQCEELFESLGMNMSTAINIFLRQSLREEGIPFAVKKERKYSARLLDAAKEAKQISSDAKIKSYSDLDEMFKDLDK